jgi:hypothetical protein
LQRRLWTASDVLVARSARSGLAQALVERVADS